MWDDHHLYFCDIASPGTRRNVEANGWIELNVVDVLSRRGYRFLGRATVHRDNDVYREATRRIYGDQGATSSVEAVILISVERALPLLSPGYEHVADEWAMREQWRGRRRELNAAFEDHIRRHGPQTR